MTAPQTINLSFSVLQMKQMLRTSIKINGRRAFDACTKYHFAYPNTHRMHYRFYSQWEPARSKSITACDRAEMPAWNPAKGKMTFRNGWTHHAGDTRVKLFLMLFLCVSVCVAKAGKRHTIAGRSNGEVAPGAMTRIVLVSASLARRTIQRVHSNMQYFPPPRFVPLAIAKFIVRDGSLRARVDAIKKQSKLNWFPNKPIKNMKPINARPFRHREKKESTVNDKPSSASLCTNRFIWERLIFSSFVFA